LFGSGFMANVALFSTLPQRGDLIVHDALIHASVHDGMRASKAERSEARHNEAQAFEDAIRDWRAAGGAGTPWIAVESLYSMDGDRAPLADLMEIARRHEGVLVIDEAHATGVFGPEGRGLGAEFEGRDNVISLHTCGKALGVMGALVLGPLVLRDYLVNRCRPFIYATAPSPLVAALVRAALLICRFDAARRERLQALVAFAGEELETRCGIAPSGSQIQPVIAGADERAVRLASAMQARGFDIRAVRPPSVPEGTARLRLSLTLNVDEALIEAMAAALAEELKRL
jgi:8-amino-7-oxononanoate synthase